MYFWWIVNDFNYISSLYQYLRNCSLRCVLVQFVENLRIDYSLFSFTLCCVACTPSCSSEHRYLQFVSECTVNKYCWQVAMSTSFHPSKVTRETRSVQLAKAKTKRYTCTNINRTSLLTYHVTHLYNAILSIYYNNLARQLIHHSNQWSLRPQPLIVRSLHLFSWHFLFHLFTDHMPLTLHLLVSPSLRSAAARICDIKSVRITTEFVYSVSSFAETCWFYIRPGAAA